MYVMVIKIVAVREVEIRSKEEGKKKRIKKGARKEKTAGIFS